MNRYDIALGRKPPEIRKQKIPKIYYMGIDVGIRDGTSITICRNHERGIILDYLKTKTMPMNDVSQWIKSTARCFTHGNYKMTGLTDQYPQRSFPLEELQEKNLNIWSYKATRDSEQYLSEFLTEVLRTYQIFLTHPSSAVKDAIPSFHCNLNDRDSLKRAVWLCKCRTFNFKTAPPALWALSL